MKFGIMTFWWSEDNYGQILQCYALQKYLHAQGHEAYLIRYDPSGDFKPSPLVLRVLKVLNPFKVFRYLITKKQQKRYLKEQYTHPRFFSVFRDTYINQSEKIYYSWKELKENPPEADAYIVGSDQVWNFGNIPVYRCYGVIHAYMLDFGKAEIKRFAYAASWGMDSLRKDVVLEIKQLLKRFDYVSVREKNGINLCMRCGYHSAEWVPDPTLFFDAATYRSLYAEYIFQNPNKKYIFLYMLNNPCNFDIKIVYKWAIQRKLKIIYVSGNGITDRYEKYFATIPEWLYLMDNAEYIITNSFHCCIFSILFKKQFGVIPLTRHCQGMNSRITSLFEQKRIPERFIINNNLQILDEQYEAQQESAKTEFYLHLFK